MFWASYPDEVKAVIRFINLHKVKVNRSAVNIVLQGHPDYPSLLCISDSLRKWKIPNAAGKINPSQIDELPTPFLAVNPGAGTPILVVNEVTSETVKYYAGNYKIPLIKSQNEFISEWNGFYLLAEPSLESGEKDFYLNRRKALLKLLLPFSSILLCISFSFYLLNVNISNQFSLNKLELIIQYSSLLSGTLVCSLLLWYEIDRNNPLLQNVCSGITKGNCTAILTSRAAKLFSWLSWSEVGFFYFLGGLLALIFFPANFITPVLTLLALPYTVFSIYYQWKIAKQWCILCLLVQLLLLLGAANVLNNGLFVPSFTFTISDIVKTICLYLLPVLTWFSLKPFLLQLQDAKNTRKIFSRLKFNKDVFYTLLQKQKQITVSTEGLGIDLGESKVQNTLIKVCNPYCGPCSQSHSKIETLLNECDNLKVKIIFNIPDKDTLPHFKLVTHFLATAEKENQEQIKMVLDGWYLPEKKDYASFAAKFPPNERINEQRKKMGAMYTWCSEEEIKVTPTFFLNGHLLPNTYNVEDLKYFLLE